MRLIVGLGNPGIEYQFTPHNAGFLAIDRLAEVFGTAVNNRRGKALTGKAVISGQEVLLAKPETFMNLSGLSVAALLQELGLSHQSDLIVLYDELAIPLGQLRIRERGSAGGHNGVKSISGVLGSEEWTRIRIGVGKQPTETGREIKAGGVDYLLSPMRRMMLQELDLVLDETVKAVETILKEGVKAAMNKFNRKVNGEDPEGPAAK
ncbi:aminoacyl-tRNA hydrolase [Granulicella tundricola]|uniref:Peptidyl-tRNA hydrolase n=1 Tax=Granulicella tundricola (strain ATCC BAA-1859 / DSM 23138 / MP5ACTX9) TaxID=1198114 RepID=E8WWR5_GRATM|nr:aminoacyl-tRNA hydrolase [Granulicella tundricola]ADW67393.1 peptidyl-tRNA hydrolase [Granulicella tundricola MP5ACTX9]